MSSNYFDSSDHQQVAATRARASAINNALDAIDTGLALLPTEANIKRGLINYGVDSGAADAYVVTLPYPALALADGMQVVFKASAVNTGACTINVDALGVKSIKRHDGTNPVAGDIGTNKITELRYNSTTTTFEIQGNVGVEAGAGTMSAQNANLVAITGGAMDAVDITGGSISGVVPDCANGLFQRSQFTWVDGDTITVGGGVYDVDGTVALITSALTTTAHGITGADWGYLYIDYSEIPATGILLQAHLIWATTEPTWSHTKLGWYSGSDRCIFACRIVVTSDDILEFFHQNNLVTFANDISVNTQTNVTITFADATALTMPKFARRASVYFITEYGDGASCTPVYRPNGATDANGVSIGYATAAGANSMVAIDVITDSGHLIEWKEGSDTTGVVTMNQVGWYLPEGI